MQNGDIVICQCIIILNRDTKSIILIGAKTIKIFKNYFNQRGKISFTIKH